MTAVLVELAEEWLAVKALASSSEDDLSTSGRRSDLSRAGRVLATVCARDVCDERNFDLARDLGAVELADLSADNMLRVIRSLKVSYAPSTAARTLSTLRTFCRWLTRHGHLLVDPTADDLLSLPTLKGDAPFRAFTQADVDALRRAAEDPAAASRTAWPARDRALVDVVSGTGLRSREAQLLQVRDIDRDVDRPALDVTRGTKGGRRRRVPLPRHAEASLDTYLADRRVRAEDNAALEVRGDALVFVRTNGSGCNGQFFDRLIERLAEHAGVELHDQTRMHGLRHYYGSQLALRSVPGAAIQELMGHADPRTTAIYTRSVGRHLTDVLDDAGWL